MRPKMYNADSDILNFLDRGQRGESENDNKETRLDGSVVSPVERRVAEPRGLNFILYIALAPFRCFNEIM